MPERALEILRRCPYLSGAEAPEAEGWGPLIRFTGGSARRRLDNTWRWDTDAEIRLFENADAACAWLAANVEELAKIAPPRFEPDARGGSWVIKLTLELEEE